MDVATEAWKALVAQGVLGALLVLALLGLVYLVANGRKDSAAAATKLAESQEARIKEGKESVKALTENSAANAALSAALAALKEAETEQAKGLASLAAGIERLDERGVRIENRQEQILELLRGNRPRV